MTLTLRFQNVGLIRQAALTTTDLSVIMGLNNSGKSTAVTSLYAAVKSAANFRTAATSMRQPFRRRNRRTGDELEAARSRLSEVRSPRDLEKAIQEVSGDVGRYVLEDYAHQFVNELELSLGTSISQLATRALDGGRKLPLKIVIENDDPEWTITISLRGTRVKTAVDLAPISVEADTLPTYLLVNEEGEADEGNFTAYADYFLDMYATQFSIVLFASLPAAAHYLPAARAGVLQSHRLVAAAMLQLSPRAGMSSFSMPSLAGTIADFVSEILLLDRTGPMRPRDRAYRSFADRIQKEVLSGSIHKIDTDTGYPEIEFRDETGSYPIHRTSSMVSELAPIVLLLQGVIGRSDLLIIEEPESHLHPKTQVVLAKILFELAQAGLRIALTTHSDFFVSEMNNLLRQNQLGRPNREAFSVGAYWMAREEDGSRLVTLPIDPLDGISDESFALVAEQLYDVQVEQQNAIIDREHA